jgi:hypothetical protein
MQHVKHPEAPPRTADNVDCVGLVLAPFGDMKSQFAHFASGLLLFAAAGVFGCAPQSPYPPYGGSADDAECRHIAESASGGTVTEVGKGAIVGGAVGAAAGAAAGAIAGNAGKGAAIGAATGGVGGAVVQGARKNQRYNDVFASCMRERGHNVY